MKGEAGLKTAYFSICSGPSANRKAFVGLSRILGSFQRNGQSAMQCHPLSNDDLSESRSRGSWAPGAAKQTPRPLYKAPKAVRRDIRPDV